MPEANTRTIPNQIQGRAMVQPKTLNEDDRTVEVIFGTDTPVRMWNWDIGEFMEIMSFEDGHVRWNRFDNGAPVLDNHNRYNGARGVLGKVENYRTENGQGIATLRFSKREDVEPIYQDVRDGILSGISFGYRVYKYEQVTSEEGELPKMRAIDWEPIEISLAPIQADSNAFIRSGEENSSTNVAQVEIIPLTLQSARSEEPEPKNEPEPITRTMTEEEKAAQAKAEQERKAQAEQERKAAIAAEKTRNTEITALCTKHKMTEEFRNEAIEKDFTVTKVRELILAKIEENQPLIDGNNSVVVGKDRAAEMERAAATAAIVKRAMPELVSGDKKVFSEDVVREAQKHRGKTALDMAKDSLIRGGESVEGLSNMEIVGRAFTSSTSDFPVILEGSAQNTLLANYQAAADTWRRFCSTGSVSDFREYKRLRMGTFSDLETVNELGEFKNKTITDADYEKVSATTKGNIINVSRQMIINDDLGAFMRLASMLGRAAARSIENDVYALLAENSGLGPTLVDGNTLIHASHNNIGASAAPSTAQIDAMRQIMAQQQDKDENDYLDIRPDIVLAPLSLGGALRVINESQYDHDSTGKYQKPNIVAGLFSDVIDTPRLSGTAYYMFANPSEEPVIEVSFLNGEQMPFMEMQQGFTVDGTKWKIRLDYGVGAVGFRGVVRSPGA